MSILLDVRQYLQERKRASLSDLCTHFDTSGEVMRGMVNKWVDKGRIARCVAPSCDGCNGGCASGPGEIYEWVD